MGRAGVRTAGSTRRTQTTCGPVAGSRQPPLDTWAPERGPLQVAWSRFRRDRAALYGVSVLLAIIALALGAPLTTATRHVLNQANLDLGIDANGIPTAPGRNGYVLGADQLGRDVLVQAAYAARTSLLVGILSTALALVIAVTLSLIAGYFGGWRDHVISRVTDFMASFPVMVFAIAMSVVLGSTLPLLVTVIAAFSWFYPARLLRARVLEVRAREFIDAAEACGCSTPRILQRHILPHLYPFVLAYGTLLVGITISFEAALSFLGFGLPADYPSWGRMIGDAVVAGRFQAAPWMMLVPGSLLTLTLLSLSFVGDGVSQAIDPHAARSFD